ncbi:MULTISPECIES: sialidase family protein [Microbacterium]|uniref:sialidase family protein n=1 Tax=Microbacterium TaxID=33882 RepID=UPI0030101B8E
MTVSKQELSRRHVLGLASAAALGTALSGASVLAPSAAEAAVGSETVSGAVLSVTPLTMAVRRVSPATSFPTNAWPQGKTSVSSTGRIYQGYNRSSGHGATDTKPLVTFSDDLGATWSTPVVIVPGESNARGTDCFALGVDAGNTLWAIIRSRGATNAVGTTRHTLYSSVDGGVSWASRVVLDAVQQGGFVPELFHDLELVGDRMMSGFHFAGSSRLGFLTFDPADPVASLAFFDVVGDGNAAYPPVTYCEPTITWDPVAGRVVGGLRTQKATGAPTQFYSMNPDGSGFARWNAPEGFAYSPLPVEIVGETVYALIVERYGSCRMALWIGDRSQFHAKNTASPVFRSIALGTMGGTPISGSTEMGVPDLASVGSTLVLSWSFEADDGSSKVLLGTIDLTAPSRAITYAAIAAL